MIREIREYYEQYDEILFLITKVFSTIDCSENPDCDWKVFEILDFLGQGEHPLALDILVDYYCENVDSKKGPLKLIDRCTFAKLTTLREKFDYPDIDLDWKYVQSSNEKENCSVSSQSNEDGYGSNLTDGYSSQDSGTKLNSQSTWKLLKRARRDTTETEFLCIKIYAAGRLFENTKWDSSLVGLLNQVHYDKNRNAVQQLVEDYAQFLKQFGSSSMVDSSSFSLVESRIQKYKLNRLEAWEYVLAMHS